MLKMILCRGVIKMGQVTIYLDNETERKMSNIVKKSATSKSKWIARLIQEKTSSTWPESVHELAGAWNDFPDIEEIRNDMGGDTEREPL
jgi:hypothetical protein